MSSAAKKPGAGCSIAAFWESTNSGRFTSSTPCQRFPSAEVVVVDLVCA
jgi:hypothetical protein